LYPAVEVAVLEFQIVVVAAIGLQSNRHFGVLLYQQLQLELLVFHLFKYYGYAKLTLALANLEALGC
jgi:hypothetical protein